MSVNLTGRKSELTSQELAILQIELEKRGKNKIITYVLWWFLGIFGGHRFYLGNTGYAVAMLLVGWLTCGIWMLVDVFFIGKELDRINSEIELQIINEITANRRHTAQQID